MKRAFIIHGWEGYPEEGWFPWLKKELESNGFRVQVPAMPKPAEPKIEAWVSHLDKLVSEADKNTFFIGHSIGCQTILRYLEKLHTNKRIGGAVFVAGWFTLQNLSSKDEWKIAKPWLETPIQWDKILTHTKNFIAIFSDNDPYVPQGNTKIFEEKLKAKIIIEHAKGHFSGIDNIKEIPVLLEELLKMVK